MTAPKPFFKSLKRKLWLQRWTVSAPQMKIRTQLPWPVRAVFTAIVVGLGGAIALWGYDLGRDITGLRPGATSAQLSSLKEQLEKVTAERDRYASTVNAAESKINIEQSAQKQLVNQVRALEIDNIKLKEDLAFFESLLPVDARAQGVSIRRLKAEIVTPNQLHYRLLVMQGGKGGQDFNGNLQLAVTVMQGGKSAIMIFPEANARDPDRFKLRFTHYQRIEGIVTVPEGATIKSVQARILDKGQMLAQQLVNL